MTNWAKFFDDAADGSRGANAKRARGNAERRKGAVDAAIGGGVEDILMRPEVLGQLPPELAARIRSGDRAAMFDAVLWFQRNPKPPPTPADQMMTPPPGGEAGFRMGEQGGRVRQESVGDLTTVEGGEILRYPGAEAGFQVDLPPPAPTGLIPSQRYPMVPYDGVQVNVRTPGNSRRNYWPAAGLAAGAAAGGKVLYDFFNQPEEAVDGAPEEPMPMQDKPIVPQSDKAAERALMSVINQDSDLNMSDPQDRTISALRDAGIDPARAMEIGRGRMSMTQMERDALIGNSQNRRQRTMDQMERRRNQRMGGY